MPTHFQLSWVRAVKEWNQHQAFQEDIYAIPKKGGESYKEVVSLREEFKRQHNAPQISEAKKEQLIPGGGRRSEKFEKEQEQRTIDEFSRKINNFNDYWRDTWKSLSAQEKMNAYNDIKIIISLQHAKSGFIYNSLKEKFDKFVIPDYAKKGYELWEKKGKPLYVKEPKGRTSNTAYDKMQRNVPQISEAKKEVKSEIPISEIPIGDFTEYHNALAGRRPRAAIAYYEKKYPQLKKQKK